MPTTETVVNGTNVSTTKAGNTALFESLRAFGIDLMQQLPEILAALLVLIVGWIIASAIARFVLRLVIWSRVDRWIRSADMETGTLNQVDMRLRVADIAAVFVKWFLILLVLSIVADILNWTQFTELMNSFIAYLPNVAAAILLLVGGYLLGNLVRSFVAGMGTSFGPRAAQAFGDIARWAIVVFAGLAALIQLGIAESLIQIAFIGLVAMMAMAGGLAFGLGGKEKAKEILADVKTGRPMTA